MILLKREQIECCYCEGEQLTFDFVREVIREYGFAILPEYFDETTTGNMREEVLNVLKDGVGRKQKFGDSLVQFSAKDELQEIGSPTINQCSTDRLINSLASDFFSPYESEFKGAFMHHDRNKSVYNHHWHWDPGTVIKAFTYLTNIEDGNGAFHISPKSQHDAYYRKLYFVPKGRKSYLTFVPETEISLGHAVEEKAGTVIIFNTNCFHKAGRIDAGRDRIIIRFSYGLDRVKHDTDKLGHVEECINPWYLSQAYEKPTD